MAFSLPLILSDGWFLNYDKQLLLLIAFMVVFVTADRKIAPAGSFYGVLQTGVLTSRFHARMSISPSSTHTTTTAILLYICTIIV